MHAFVPAVEAVVPTFLLMALGALTDRLFPDLRLETLTRLSLYVLMPALVFDALATTELRLDEATRLALAYLLYLTLTGLAAALAARGLSRAAGKALVACSLFGNTGNMALPITLFAYGVAGLERALVLLVLSSLLMFSFAPALLSPSGEPLGGRVRQALTLPPLWGGLLAVLANLVAFDVPLVLERSVSLVGSAAIPIMLLSLGMQMRRTWVWTVSNAALRATLVRLVAGPALAFAAATILALPGLDRNVLVLSATMPVAVTMFVLAVEVRGDHSSVARTVVTMTIVSVVTITLALAWLPSP